MEKLLHYVWKHKMLPLTGLMTTDGRQLEVVNPGLYNRSDAGPDFFNAQIKIDGMSWAGNVELHIKSSDWYRHRHDEDPAYDSIILHVVTEADMEIETSKGVSPTTVVLPIPEQLRHDYQELLSTDKFPPCYEMIPSLHPLKIHSWISTLQTERLEQKTLAMTERVKQLDGSWEAGYFATLARNYGFGINNDACEAWAMQMPLSAVARHRDNLFQIESLFLGQAGLLDKVDEKYAKEYLYLKHRFDLTPMDGTQWKYLRTRPQNFPHVRMMELARLYCEEKTSISALLECKTRDDLRELYGLSGDKLNLIAINTAVPTMFAYGREHGRESLCETALDILGSLAAEKNKIIRMWKECGIRPRNAGDSQALIQLKREYCDKKYCVRCRFGYEFLSGEYRNRFLSEEGTC